MKFFKTALFVTALCAASAAASAQDLMPAQGVAIPQGSAAVASVPATAAPAPATAPAPSVSLGDDEGTYPTISLTPDKSQILTLDKPARSVIVGNPAHLAAIMDSTTRLVLIPRTPGATYFMVLGENGEVIMQRHVLVDAPQEHYVRIRRSCALAGSGNCAPTEVYYCPGMCHQINVQTSTSGGGVANVTVQGAAPAPAQDEQSGAAPEPAQDQPAGENPEPSPEPSGDDNPGDTGNQ
jgi:hypothetical protein